jgi:single-strand DNA-binding protein
VYGLARIGRDPEIRYTTRGDAVASLSLAFSWGKKDPQTGYRETTWIEASLWGSRAEALVPHLAKGAKVLVALEELHEETFEGRNGPGRKLAARVSDIDFAGDPATPAEAPPKAQERPQERAAPARAPAVPPRRAAPPASPRMPVQAGGSGFDDMDDDVPY